MRKLQGGNVIVGIIIGVVLGLAAALAVAVYVTKVPVPFLNRGSSRTAEQDAAESRKNQNWDPNAPLYGKNPAKALPPAPGVVAPPPLATMPPTSPLAPAEKDGKEAKATDKPAAAASAAKPATAAAAASAAKPATAKAPSTDPLGDLASARAATAPGPTAAGGSAGTSGDPFLYFVQAGAFRTPEDAEAQRAKLSLMGLEARVTEREQSGRQVYRVRLGPFESKDAADRQKEKLEAGGFETALVRVQR